MNNDEDMDNEQSSMKSTYLRRFGLGGLSVMCWRVKFGFNYEETTPPHFTIIVVDPSSCISFKITV